MKPTAGCSGGYPRRLGLVLVRCSRHPAPARRGVPVPAVPERYESFPRAAGRHAAQAQGPCDGRCPNRRESFRHFRAQGVLRGVNAGQLSVLCGQGVLSGNEHSLSADLHQLAIASTEQADPFSNGAAAQQGHRPRNGAAVRAHLPRLRGSVNTYLHNQVAPSVAHKRRNDGLVVEEARASAALLSQRKARGCNEHKIFSQSWLQKLIARA